MILSYPEYSYTLSYCIQINLRCKQWTELCKNEEIIDIFKSHDAKFFNKNGVIYSDHFKASDYVIWKGIGNKS